MQYTISINQKAILDGGFNIDLVDATIIDYCKTFFSSPKISRLFYEEEVFFWIDYAHMISELPILGITNKAVLGRRMKNLCDQGIFVQKISKQNGNKTYFHFGEKYCDLISEVCTQEYKGMHSKVQRVCTQKYNHIKEISIPVISIPDQSMDLSVQNSPAKGSFEEAEIYFQKLGEEIENDSLLELQERKINKELIKFYLYWTAPMKSGKLLWRSKPTFSFGLRLANWMGDKKEKTIFNFSKPTGVGRI